MKTNNQNKSINTNLKFVDYSSFEELSGDQEILEGLINGYRNIFSEPDVWNEQYSHKEIHDKLRYELNGYAALRICINNDSQSVVGFCWAQLLKANEISKSMQSVHYYKAYDSSETEQALHNIIGEDSFIYVHDLGVSESYRGTVQLEKLICPVIENVSQRANTQNIFFWSVKETSVAWLAGKMDIKVALTVGKIQIFKGQYHSSKLELLK